MLLVKKKSKFSNFHVKKFQFTIFQIKIDYVQYEYIQILVASTPFKKLFEFQFFYL